MWGLTEFLFCIMLGTRCMTFGLWIPCDLRARIPRRKSVKKSGALMLIRCLCCETRETFASKVIYILIKMRFLQLMRLDLTS